MKKIEIVDIGNEKLSLKNSGFLSLFFIGVGSAFSKIHYQTNAVVIKGNSHFLIDCGTLTPLGLWEYGCPIMNINSILVTHSHADHIGGLEEAALMGRYVARKKTKLIVTRDYEKMLWENSLKGGIAYNERHNGKDLEYNDVFESLYPQLICEDPRPFWELNYENFNLKIFRTKHIPDSIPGWKEANISYGVLIDERILFTSDTQHDPDLINYCLIKYPSIELIVHDCQLFKGGVHAAYEELLEYPEDVRMKMVLSHYGDNYNNFNPESDKFLGFARQGNYYNFK